MKGHNYEFSPRAIYEYLNIHILENFNFEKEYVLDDVAIELLGYKCVWPKINILRVADRVWPKTNVLRVADLTLKYNGLHKIALSNWLPTKHVTTLSQDFATLLYDISIGAPVHFGQIFFDLIVSHRCGMNMGQKLPFLALILDC